MQHIKFGTYAGALQGSFAGIIFQGVLLLKLRWHSRTASEGSMRHFWWFLRRTHEEGSQNLWGGFTKSLISHIPNGQLGRIFWPWPSITLPWPSPNMVLVHLDTGHGCKYLNAPESGIWGVGCLLVLGIPTQGWISWPWPPFWGNYTILCSPWIYFWLQLFLL